ncbi:MAG: hypothetical protein FWF85_06930 [Clostridiales bacterium]|jgi:DNA polymerase-3 subunit delta'|nr:hypothetical protein [Clostridiales bacterium]
MDKAPKLHPLLTAALKNGSLSHAYLLLGGGALVQAELLAQALFCLEDIDGRPCGECNPCLRIRHGNHPDLIWLRPLDNYLRLEQISKMQSQANLASFEGGAQVFVIEKAEAMRDVAANSLLKILEEPPLGSYFFLCAMNEQKLPGTIISRCQLINCGGEDAFSIDEALLDSFLPQAEDFLRNLPAKSCSQILMAAKSWDKNKEGALYFLLALLRILHRQLKEPNPHNFFPGEKNLNLCLLLEKALSYLQSNINQNLLLDVVFLRLLGAAK